MTPGNDRECGWLAGCLLWDCCFILRDMKVLCYIQREELTAMKLVFCLNITGLAAHLSVLKKHSQQYTCLLEILCAFGAIFNYCSIGLAFASFCSWC